ncbi:MAG: toxin-antitoxin system YwqK family antitoxin [Bacteriovoracaceae bacterium]
MGILSRIKRRELEGFKEFVTSLETTTESRRKEIIQIATLEDPIYMSWVLKNISSAKEIIKLSSDQIEKILKALPNGVFVLAKAFYNQPEIEYIKTQVLSRYMLSEFEECLQKVKGLKKAEHEGCQFLIMKMARDLQAKEDIYGPFWFLPPVELMKEDKMKSFTGLTEIKFENGTLAAKGPIVKNLRDGEWEHFFDNGKLMAKGDYDQGQKIGPWSFWYVNGNIKSTGIFKNDSKHGVWKEFDQEGKESSCNYEEGKRL